MIRTVLALLALTVSPHLAGAVDPMSGRWSGYWVSNTNGHRGPLRATVTPTGGGYDVRFSGRFAKVIPFTYRTQMSVVGVAGETTVLAAERRLPLFGMFRTEAVVTPTTFDATFRSGKDSGRFVLGR